MYKNKFMHRVTITPFPSKKEEQFLSYWAIDDRKQKLPYRNNEQIDDILNIIIFYFFARYMAVENLTKKINNT